MTCEHMLLVLIRPLARLSGTVKVPVSPLTPHRVAASVALTLSQSPQYPLWYDLKLSSVLCN